MSKALREAANEFVRDYDEGDLGDLKHYARALRAALAEDGRDWSLLEATQESLREHMAEIQQLRATLAQALAAMATCVSSSDGEDSWFDHEQVYAARNAARAVMAKPATVAEWWAAYQESDTSGNSTE